MEEKIRAGRNRTITLSDEDRTRLRGRLVTLNPVVEPENPVVECPTGRIETTVNLEKVVPPGGFDTASGLLNHRLTKTYRAKLAAPVSVENKKEYISRAATGLSLPPEKKYGEQKALPATIIFETASICKITVNEGKFHEVRRIFRALGKRGLRTRTACHR